MDVKKRLDEGTRTRGRPVKSLIRERMQEIVDALGVTYGYEIFKVYNNCFESIDLRSVYYHLAKGVSLGEFELVGEQAVRGPFTWGEFSIRRYYIPGPNISQKCSSRVLKSVESFDLEHRDLKNFIDWALILDRKIKDYEVQLQVYLKKTGKMRATGLRGLLEKIEVDTGWFGKYADISGFSKLIGEVKKALKS